VRSGQTIYVSDRALVLGPTDSSKPARKSTVDLRFNGTEESKEFAAFTSLFGAHPHDETSPRFTQINPSLAFDETNHQGCLPYELEYLDQILVVHRGECAFVEKLMRAKEAGASGVVVLSDVDSALNPSVDESDLATIGDTLDGVVLVVLPKTAATQLLEMMGAGQVTLTVVPVEVKEPELLPQVPPVLDDNRVLYLNGHPLTNTRLTV
jgi:mannosidase alpha-like ER degradation enhancer 1